MDATTYNWKEPPKPGDKVTRIWESSSSGKMRQGNTYTIKNVGVNSLSFEEVDESWSIDYFAPAILLYMKYTKKDIHQGYEFINDHGKGRLYRVEELNSNGETCHLKDPKGSYSNEAYPLSILVTHLNDGNYIPVIPELNYQIY